MIESFIAAFATLFVTLDPIGNVPIFMALMAPYPIGVQRAIAARSCLMALGILLAFAFAGNSLLGFLGISLAALEITGGLLLLIVAIDMVFERRSAQRQRRADEVAQTLGATEEGATEAHPMPWQALAIFPLAIPLLAGAGTMTSLLVVSAGASFTAPAFTMALLALVLVIGLFGALLMITIALGDRVNRQVYLVLTRIMGVILAALSVQFMISGIRTAFGL